MATRGKHNGSHILRFVPQQDTNSNHMKTSDMLLFVKSKKTSVQASMLRALSPERDQENQGNNPTFVGQMIQQMNLSMSPRSGFKQTRKSESLLLKSLEKDAVYLAERFGQNAETLDKRKIDEQISSSNNLRKSQIKI